MYIAVYDENRNHITNLDNATYSLTQRVYDPDSFTADAQSSEDINAAKILVVNDDYGNYIYSSLVDNIKPEDNIRTIKGLDFKTLFDTDILIDYTQPGSFDSRLSATFNKISALVFNDPDIAIQKIPVIVNIPEDNTPTLETIGDFQGEYLITNAYAFLKVYLKFYEYNIESRYDEAAGKIILFFVKTSAQVDIGLVDFMYELQTTSDATNKAVATIEYKPEVEQDAGGNDLPTPPRPSGIATKYYYRDKKNSVIEMTSNTGNIPDRIYPVRCKIFEAEYLAAAQLDAAYEIANSRFIDNIILDHNKIIDPIDLSGLALYTKLNIYYRGAFYKTLPISEKTTTADSNGYNIKIKLGFKKILLTEIIKGG